MSLPFTSWLHLLPSLLALLECPSPAALQRATLADLPGSTSTLESRIARVRRRHFIPNVSVHGFINDNASAQQSTQQLLSGSWRSGVGVEVRLTFHLADAVYDEHEATLQRDALAMAREHRLLRKEILTLHQRLSTLRSELVEVAAQQPALTASGILDTLSEAQQVWLELDALSAGACREYQLNAFGEPR